ncbi:hypothetical protein RHECNPAF_3030019 [Rhizobium etli CNPAF512]|nr:hypothetical protein RHECNPAF_3030019 [Rhizobium etli CNPAF512]
MMDDTLAELSGSAGDQDGFAHGSFLLRCARWSQKETNARIGIDFAV